MKSVQNYWKSVQNYWKSVQNHWKDDVYHHSPRCFCPAFLSPYVVDYILTENVLEVHVTPDDVANPGLREALKEVSLGNRYHHIINNTDLSLVLFPVCAYCING